MGGLNLTFSPETGALTSLLHVASGHEWAGVDHQLGAVIYQTFDEAHSYDTFLSEYISYDVNAPGADQYPHFDFGKDGVDAAASPEVLVVHPTVRSSSVWLRQPGLDGYDASFIVELDYGGDLHTKYGAPNSSTLLLSVNSTGLQLHYTLVHWNKTRTRLPEASWLSFNPRNKAGRTAEVWKVDQWVDLAAGVMGNGSAHLHVVQQRGVRVAGAMEAGSPDVGLVCIGYPPTPFPTPLAAIVGEPAAFAFNTHNNIWSAQTQTSQLPSPSPHLTSPHLTCWAHYQRTYSIASAAACQRSPITLHLLPLTPFSSTLTPTLLCRVLIAQGDQLPHVVPVRRRGRQPAVPRGSQTATPGKGRIQRTE